MPRSRGERHEGRHQKGGLGSARANAGDGGNARYRQHHLLLEVTVIARSGRDEAIQLVVSRRIGLLRCARNDVPTPYSLSHFAFSK